MAQAQGFLPPPATDAQLNLWFNGNPPPSPLPIPAATGRYTFDINQAFVRGESNLYSHPRHPDDLRCTQDRSDLRFFLSHDARGRHHLFDPAAANPFHTISSDVLTAQTNGAPLDHWTTKTTINGVQSPVPSLRAAIHEHYKRVTDAKRIWLSTSTGTVVSAIVSSTPGGAPTWAQILNTYGRNAVLSIFNRWITALSPANEFRVVLSMMGPRGVPRALNLDAIYNVHEVRYPQFNARGVDIVPVLVEYIRYSVAWGALLHLETYIVGSGSRQEVAAATAEWRAVAARFHRMVELSVEELPIRLDDH